ncbi:helicase associated domain-containing protein [Streptomyces sp. CLV115]|uniref:helicase associated domain-containing protein n=1 Tax=Streptomyces sp. CLV115 TaxID=3138502 RepID=UPI00313EE540
MVGKTPECPGPASRPVLRIVKAAVREHRKAGRNAGLGHLRNSREVLGALRAHNTETIEETGAQQLRCRTATSPGRPAPTGFPLGTWLADQRRRHKAGRLDTGRVEQLDRLGTV